MSDQDRLEYSLEAQLDSLGSVRAYIDEKGQALGLDKQLLGDLRLVRKSATALLAGRRQQNSVIFDGQNAST